MGQDHDISIYIIYSWHVNLHYYLKSHDPINQKFYGHGENDRFVCMCMYIWLNNTVDFSIKKPHENHTVNVIVNT